MIHTFLQHVHSHMFVLMKCCIPETANIGLCNPDIVVPYLKITWDKNLQYQFDLG